MTNHEHSRSDSGLSLDLERYNSRYSYRIGSVSTNYGAGPVFYEMGKEGFPKGVRFGSLYAVTRDDAAAIQEAKTPAHFRGTVWSRRLWLDLDSQEAAGAVRERLLAMKLDYVEYTTGNRGCHLGVLRDSIPSHLLPLQDKAWVKEHAPEADMSIYWALHLFRLPGAIHEKTGKPKRQTAHIPGGALVHAPFQPQSAREAGTIPPIAPKTPIFGLWGVMSRLGPVEGGQRHKRLVELAVTLKNEGKLSPQETLWMLGQVNMGYGEPKSFEELNSIVEWAYGT